MAGIGTGGGVPDGFDLLSTFTQPPKAAKTARRRQIFRKFMQGTL